ncbi:flagellar basal body-associated FliL family protein [Atlantibacter subterraneus]|uniref:flagellar basal body-associated FliL family protein n=1 Tax=Atlantibacter subterraneus TaxID=255519 RepID=UPI0028A129EF|nr:flagellar basal body-associated FliL family protein [Atlantibacter subterranea]
MKKLILGGVINAVIALAFGGGAAWGVNHYLHAGNNHDAKSDKHASVEKIKVDMKDSVFISLPETLITLHDKDDKDRYMLIEIAFVADGKDKEKSDLITANQPLYQSIAVETLSTLSYEEVRKLHVSEIKDLLLTSINKGVSARNMEAPYNDLLIKKVVYQ